MASVKELASELSSLLGLTHSPVAVTFSASAVAGADNALVAQQPAGCCFWAPAESTRLQTTPADHAHCSVGSYTHGMKTLEAAASGQDTAALVGSGWVTAADLASAPHIPFRPNQVTYEPLSQAQKPDVVLMRLTPLSLMTLMSACPDLKLVNKPQCQIVPLAYSGAVSVSPGCAVSRVRTDLPAGELTCAMPGARLAGIVEQMRNSTCADNAVAQYAAEDRIQFK
jgi:uncharacterized protein (DUF169 family)